MFEDDNVPAVEPTEVTPPSADAEPQVEPTETPVAPPEPPKPAPASKALIGRIDTLTKNWREEQRQRAALEAEIAQLRAGTSRADSPPPGASGPTDPTVVPVSEVERRANEIAQARTFTDQCNKIYTEGKGVHADFDARIADVAPFGGLTGPMVEAAMEMDNPHEVLYGLMQDLEKFAEISTMSPVRQAAAIAKFASARAPAPAKKTNAPPPVRPVVGGGRVPAEPALDDDNLPMEKWMAQRAAQVKELQKKGMRIS